MHYLPDEPFIEELEGRDGMEFPPPPEAPLEDEAVIPPRVIDDLLDAPDEEILCSFAEVLHCFGVVVAGVVNVEVLAAATDAAGVPSGDGCCSCHCHCCFHGSVGAAQKGVAHKAPKVYNLPFLPNSTFCLLSQSTSRHVTPYRTTRHCTNSNRTSPQHMAHDT